MKMLVALITFLVGMVKGATNDFPGFLMGSLDNVEKHAVLAGNSAWITVWYTYQGQYKPISSATLVTNITFTSRAKMDEWFADKIRVVASAAINKEVGQNRELPFFITAFFTKNYFDTSHGFYFLDMFEVRKEFSLNKSWDGYSLPDLSGMRLELLEETTYWIPQLKWVRLSVMNEDGYPILTRDSTDNPVSGIDLLYFSIPTALAVSAGDGVRVKVSIITGNDLNFQVFTNGVRAAEELPVLSSTAIATSAAKKSAVGGDNSAYLRIVGGEPGRSYRIQTASKLNGLWKNLPDTETTVWPGTEEEVFYLENGQGNTFYRVKSFPRIPISIK